MVGEWIVGVDAVSLSIDCTNESEPPGGWDVNDSTDGRPVVAWLPGLLPRSKLALPYSCRKSSVLVRFSSLPDLPASRLSRGELLPLLGVGGGKKVAFTLSRSGVAERNRVLLERISRDPRGSGEAVRDSC